jgi:hypothetical protein
MSEKAESTFIVIHETVLHSWMRDASTFALFAGLIGVGILADSTAMQWAGFFVAIVACIARASGMKTKRMTRDEAIVFLASPNQTEDAA